MAGVSSCMKYSMFIFNFAFWVSSCGFEIIITSLLISVDELNIDNSLFAAVDLLIAVGSIIMVLGFLGCCGAVKESKCMLLLFFIGLLLILILQLVAGILGAVLCCHFDFQVETALNKTFLEDVKKLQDNPVFQEKFQKLEIKNKCCGLLKGPEDWGTKFQQDFSNNKICECAQADKETDLCRTYNGRRIYAKVRMIFFKNHMVILIGIAFGLAVIEVHYKPLKYLLVDGQWVEILVPAYFVCTIPVLLNTRQDWSY
uniref:Tetraspanin 8 n=1 Tax=Sphenodon punctatus TaxID=8508 RepID=A0A8D0G647_SPHPU